MITKKFVTEFKRDISVVKLKNDIFILLLSIPNSINEIDNIYGVNEDGKVFWRIENPVKAFNINKDEQGFNYYASSTYVFMNESPEGIFTANTFSGMRYSFDYLTGKLIRREQSRW